ncbi:MAG: hypothetical protein ABSD59_06685 [Terracidiphilus sp.]|jgi:hypothetical protein
MSDTLYLSLWYPNLLLEALPDKLTAVLDAFVAHGGEPKVYSATVWPVNWSESPVFQRVYGRMGGAGSIPGAEPRLAVEEALELLHDDYAYEFQMGWNLWGLEVGAGGTSAAGKATAGPSTPVIDITSAQGRLSTRRLTAANDLAQDDRSKFTAQNDNLHLNTPNERVLSRWARGPRLVRVTGFGPLFDEGTYEQDGHIRIDFGSDTPFLEEDADLDQVGARHVEENVRQLVELAGGVEKTSGATARLLWSELGESLAQRLAERLGMRN